MTAEECIVVGCGSSAYVIDNLSDPAGWASYPTEIAVCNLHKRELAQPDTEWMLDRNERKLYVGDSLRNLNEYIVLDDPSELITYGTGREFSHDTDDGDHLPLRVRRRGDTEKEIVLVFPKIELLRALSGLIRGI